MVSPSFSALINALFSNLHVYFEQIGGFEAYRSRREGPFPQRHVPQLTVCLRRNVVAKNSRQGSVLLVRPKDELGSVFSGFCRGGRFVDFYSVTPQLCVAFSTKERLAVEHTGQGGPSAVLDVCWRLW